MRGHGTKLGHKKEKAIAALISCRTPEEAAKSIGIHPKTLQRWLRDEDFAEEYLEARRQLVQQANARIQQHSGAAAAVLLKLAADPTTPPGVKARVALGLLEHSNKTLLVEELAIRVEAMELAMRKQK
jgi:Helix-turn-helix domain